MTTPNPTMTKNAMTPSTMTSRDSRSEASGLSLLTRERMRRTCLGYGLPRQRRAERNEQGERREHQRDWNHDVALRLAAGDAVHQNAEGEVPEQHPGCHLHEEIAAEQGDQARALQQDERKQRV